MWRFFNFFNSEQTQDAGPEIVVSTDVRVDTEHGTALYKTFNDDDNDNDDKLAQNAGGGGGAKIVFTERFADEQYEDDDYADGTKGAIDEDFYQELSDAEPDSEFLNGCFEYLPMGELCYAIRRVGSNDTNILAHESTAVVAFCYALQKYTDDEMRRVCSDDHAVDEKELDELSQKSTEPGEIPPPLGVIGWFVQNVMNSKPVFAFDSEDTMRKKIIDLTSSTPAVTNPAIVTAGNSSGVPLINNGHKSDERIAEAYRYGIGIGAGGSETLQGRDRRFLRLFQRYGQTMRPSFDPADDRDGFISTSPATPSNGRWFVVDAQHYALYRSNEELVSRSGASLSRLAATLDSEQSVLKTIPAGVTQQQARAVFEQYLKEENVQTERQRERVRSNTTARLRVKCSQIVALRDVLRTAKAPAVSILSPSNANGQADITFIADTLAEIETIITALESEQITNY